MKFRDTEDLLVSIVFMRSEEMLLNEAEALARLQGNAAKDLLWQLQENAWGQKDNRLGQRSC
jgi:hypothetical protein